MSAPPPTRPTLMRGVLISTILPLDGPLTTDSVIFLFFGSARAVEGDSERNSERPGGCASRMFATLQKRSTERLWSLSTVTTVREDIQRGDDSDCSRSTSPTRPWTPLAGQAACDAPRRESPFALLAPF